MNMPDDKWKWTWKKRPRPKGNYKSGHWYCWKCHAHIKHDQKEDHKKECGRILQ